MRVQPKAATHVGEGCMRISNIDIGRVILGSTLMLIVSVTDGSP